MEYKNLVTSFVRGWNFTRSETLEILDSLNEEQLQFKPQGEKFQKLCWEFACIGRTQLVYSSAIATGKMEFSLFASLPKKEVYQAKRNLKELLEKANSEWVKNIRIRRNEEDFLISWPGFRQPLVRHIASLGEHERLHHGQFISYFTLAGFELPKGFKQNWDL